MDRSDEHSNPFDGLKALSKTAFPRQCRACGRRFESPHDFIQQTKAVGSGVSGLKSARDESDRPIVELFRNCPCGSTLLDCFDDRRDLSEPGHRRRKLTDQLMHLLENKGMPKDQARVEVLKRLKGERSEILTQMGIDLDHDSPGDKRSK